MPPNQTYKQYIDKNGKIYKKEYFQTNQQGTTAYKYQEDLFLDGLIYTKKLSTAGLLLEEGSYITTNIRQGEWKFYSPAGTLQKRIVYEYGFETKATREIYPSNNGLEIITAVTDHFPNGAIKERKYYTRDTTQPTGNWEYYTATNNTTYLEKIEVYQANELRQKIYYYPQTTTKTIENYLNNQAHGHWLFYDAQGTPRSQYFNKGRETYENGQIMEDYIRVPTRNNEAVYTRYYDDGSVMSECLYLSGKRTNNMTQYPKGKLFLKKISD